MTLDRFDLDPDFAGDCAWCGEPCLHSQPLVDGKDGEGVMHRECAVEKDEERPYPHGENRYMTESELDRAREKADRAWQELQR